MPAIPTLIARTKPVATTQALSDVRVQEGAFGDFSGMKQFASGLGDAAGSLARIASIKQQVTDRRRADTLRSEELRIRNAHAIVDKELADALAEPADDAPVSEEVAAARRARADGSTYSYRIRRYNEIRKQQEEDSPLSPESRASLTTEDNMSLKTLEMDIGSNKAEQDHVYDGRIQVSNRTSQVIDVFSQRIDDDASDGPVALLETIASSGGAYTKDLLSPGIDREAAHKEVTEQIVQRVRQGSANGILLDKESHDRYRAALIDNGLSEPQADRALAPIAPTKDNYDSRFSSSVKLLSRGGQNLTAGIDAAKDLLDLGAKRVEQGESTEEEQAIRRGDVAGAILSGIGSADLGDTSIKDLASSLTALNDTRSPVEKVMAASDVSSILEELGLEQSDIPEGPAAAWVAGRIKAVEEYLALPPQDHIANDPDFNKAGEVFVASMNHDGELSKQSLSDIRVSAKAALLKKGYDPASAERESRKAIPSSVISAFKNLTSGPQANDQSRAKSLRYVARIQKEVGNSEFTLGLASGMIRSNDPMQKSTGAAILAVSAVVAPSSRKTHLAATDVLSNVVMSAHTNQNEIDAALKTSGLSLADVEKASIIGAEASYKPSMAEQFRSGSYTGDTAGSASQYLGGFSGHFTAVGMSEDTPVFKEQMYKAIVSIAIKRAAPGQALTIGDLSEASKEFAKLISATGVVPVVSVSSSGYSRVASLVSTPFDIQKESTLSFAKTGMVSSQKEAVEAAQATIDYFHGQSKNEAAQSHSALWGFYSDNFFKNRLPSFGGLMPWVFTNQGNDVPVRNFAMLSPSGPKSLYDRISPLADAAGITQEDMYERKTWLANNVTYQVRNGEVWAAIPQASVRSRSGSANLSKTPVAEVKVISDPNEFAAMQLFLRDYGSASGGVEADSPLEVRQKEIFAARKKILNDPKLSTDEKRAAFAKLPAYPDRWTAGTQGLSEDREAAYIKNLHTKVSQIE